MIRRLVGDAVLLLLRGKACVVILTAGLITGLFARATRDTGARELHGAALKGAALETLAGSLFLIALVAALVAGLLLAHEDRRSGFLALIAVRPVRRLTYVSLRLLGLASAVLLYLVLLTCSALVVAGIGADDLPSLRERVRAERIEIDGAPLLRGGIGQIALGAPGRFHFPAGAEPVASLLLRPKITFGSAGAFSGRLELDVTLESAGQGPDALRTTHHPPPFRPLRELPIRFERAELPGAAPFVLEIEPRVGSFVLEVEHDSLTTLGADVSFVWDGLLSMLLLWLAACAVASLSFVFGLGLSPGPASLAASFLLLVGLGRDVVLDIVAGIGAHEAELEAQPDPGASWLRSFLTILVRMVPDFGGFNPALRIGSGEALTAGELLGAAGVTAATLLCALILAAAVAPFRER